MTGQNVATEILVIEARHQEDVTEEIARARASFVYHDHPSSCETFVENAKNMGRSNAHCPCEDGWRDHLD